MENWKLIFAFCFCFVFLFHVNGKLAIKKAQGADLNDFNNLYLTYDNGQSFQMHPYLSSKTVYQRASNGNAAATAAALAAAAAAQQHNILNGTDDVARLVSEPCLFH